MEIAVQRKKSVSPQVSKQNVPFQPEFPTYECDVKNDPIGLPESELNKKIRLRLRNPGRNLYTCRVVMFLLS